MKLLCQDTTTKALSKNLLAHFKGLHMLPYNYNRREESSVWWLTTAERNPAYRFLKFVVLPPDFGNPDEFFFGIYVEKGIGATYGKEGRISNDYILSPVWAWNDFVNHTLTDARFGQAVAEVAANTGIPVELRLYAHQFVKDAVRTVVPKPELLAFDVRDSFVRSESKKRSNLLASLESCSSFTDLSSALKKIPGGEYLWIDLVLGTPFKIVQDDTDVWSPEEIAKKVLAPFRYLIQ